MSYTLRPGHSFCIIDGAALFLDLPGDRYFRLPANANAAFIALVAGERPESDDLRKLDATGVIEASPDSVRLMPASCVAPARRSEAIDSGDFRLADVARALWMQRRAERRLAARPLHEVLGDCARLRRSSASAEIGPDSPAGRVLRAFEFARLLRSPANRCLPRSIAVALCLARKGIAVDVVLGVKLGPFAAHCWAQSGDVVLNDTVEEVARFTPILVV